MAGEVREWPGDADVAAVLRDRGIQDERIGIDRLDALAARLGLDRVTRYDLNTLGGDDTVAVVRAGHITDSAVAGVRAQGSLRPDRLVAPVGLEQLLLGDPDKAAVDIHEPGHGYTPFGR